MAREPVDRTERLLALLLLQNMKSASQREKVLQLSLAGFSNVEIADLLSMSGPGVAQALYEARRPSAARKATKRSTKKRKTS